MFFAVFLCFLLRPLPPFAVVACAVPCVMPLWCSSVSDFHFACRTTWCFSAVQSVLALFRCPFCCGCCFSSRLVFHASWVVLCCCGCVGRWCYVVFVVGVGLCGLVLLCLFDCVLVFMGCWGLSEFLLVVCLWCFLVVVLPGFYSWAFAVIVLGVVVFACLVLVPLVLLVLCGSFW